MNLEVFIKIKKSAVEPYHLGYSLGLGTDALYSFQILSEIALKPQVWNYSEQTFTFAWYFHSVIREFYVKVSDIQKKTPLKSILREQFHSFGGNFVKFKRIWSGLGIWEIKNVRTATSLTGWKQFPYGGIFR